MHKILYKSYLYFFSGLTVWAFKVHFKDEHWKTLLGASYSVVYVMTMYNTNIQWNDVAFVLYDLVQLHTMIFPKFMKQFLTKFALSLSLSVEILQHVSYYLLKVLKRNV